MLPRFPVLSRRQWLFFAISWLLFAIAITLLSFFAAATEDASAGDGSLWAGIAALFLGPSLLVAITSLALFGVSRRIKNAFGLVGIGFGLMLLCVIVVTKPQLLHGPRSFLFGSASGSPAAIAATDAAWVDVSPAFVDTTRLGYATHTTTDNEGRSSTRSSAVAPILTAHGESDPTLLAAERVGLFLCLDDKDDVIAESRGNGTISGRMHRADFLELEAMDDARVTNRIAAPRCVVPGRGASRIWFALWIAVILTGATVGASLVTGFVAPARR